MGGKHYCVLAFEKIQGVKIGLLSDQLPIQIELVQAARAGTYEDSVGDQANISGNLDLFEFCSYFIIAVNSG